jgi:GntR family transcriptional regulator
MRFGGRVIIVIDSDSGTPVYRQIVDQVRFQVASGLLAPGDALPSTRSLSQELGVNPMTVSKSYQLLEEEGLLTHRPGLPLMVSERRPEEVGRDRALELEKLLLPVAVAARQLGMEAGEAVELFRRVLEFQVSGGESRPGGVAAREVVSGVAEEERSP